MTGRAAYTEHAPSTRNAHDDFGLWTARCKAAGNWRNRAALEEVAVKLEGAGGAVATASGMAAIVVALCTMMQSGEELVVANDCYGGTLSVAARDFPRLGIASRFVPTTNLAALEKALSSATKVLLVETLSNPLW